MSARSLPLFVLPAIVIATAATAADLTPPPPPPPPPAPVFDPLTHIGIEGGPIFSPSGLTSDPSDKFGDIPNDRGFYVAIETNGTRSAPGGIDWICVSPKVGAPLLLTSGDELKLVFPQAGGDPEQYEGLDFQSFRLSPMDGSAARENTAAAVEYCLKRPKWQLSLQTHKYLGIP